MTPVTSVRFYIMVVAFFSTFLVILASYLTISNQKLLDTATDPLGLSLFIILLVIISAFVASRKETGEGLAGTLS